MTAGRYELAKMAVGPKAEGNGIGYQLGTAAIDWVKQNGGRQIYLETNSALGPAIALYEKLGFKPPENLEDSPYSRCDVQLVLDVT